MKTVCLTIIAILLQSLSVSVQSQQAKIIDLYERIFTDSFPVGEYNATFDIPRNYQLSFPIAVRHDTECSYKVKVLIEKDGNKIENEMNFFSILPVTVEGNTQGSMINVPGGSFPESWTPYLVRKAPFQILEALMPVSNNHIFTVSPDITAGTLIRIDWPEGCIPGTYNGRVEIEFVENNLAPVVLPFTVHLHKTSVKRENFIDCAHWLSYFPEDLCRNGSTVQWWGEEQWQIHEHAAKRLYEDGNNMMFTPLCGGDHPLIQTYYKNGNLRFDYSLFDKWITSFSNIGFRYFAGSHLRSLTFNTKIIDESTNTTKTILQVSPNTGCFLEKFLKDLYSHLVEQGWENKFLMHVIDEPSYPRYLDEYKHYQGMVNRFMPGIKTIDATNSSPQQFSPMVDFQVYNLNGIIRNKNGEVKSRIESGRPVWLYNTTSPFPPYPNRHLDRYLPENRLWPLLALKYNASGYLFWAVNTYRGVPDEYATSLGPLPDGTQKHCPGDAWFYYRVTNGLIGSMRMLSFKEGLIDVALLKELSEVYPDKTKEQLDKLIWPQIEEGQDRPWKDYPYIADDVQRGYELISSNYHHNRKETLEMLDQIKQ